MMAQAAIPPASAKRSPAAAAVGPTGYFFKNELFEFTLQQVLGRSFHQAGSVGKTLHLVRQIEDGNCDSAFSVLKAAGDEAKAIAEDSAGKGHRESARQAYMWAQNYYAAATYFLDGSSDPSRFLPTWELLDDCWLRSLAFFDPAIEPISIAYEGTALRGFYFTAARTSVPRPLLILNNGSDGSLLDMWTSGAAAGLARGYDCLAFDGPGQGYALWRQQLYFRPDWEKVITAVVDFALSRPDVDPRRIVVQGVSQGGYWVPRAAAFEKRIAAIIADPGVVDVSTSWLSHLPPPMIELLKGGQKAEFDGYMAEMSSPAEKATLAFRMRPFGSTSYFDVYTAVMAYTLKDIAGRITCPVLVTEPANETFWPGQSAELYSLLTAPKTLMPFTVADGADLHCEPMGAGLRELRVFNWPDETLA